jgi:adenylylsulfate kinase-like enzyme
MIVVLFGQPCSGKSTIAKQLATHNIDGDKLRELFANKDYSREGRIKNLNRASDIAHYLNNSIENIKLTLSLVYPYKEARDYLNSLTENVKWVYLTYEGERGRENFHAKDFEEPNEENILHLDTSKLSLEDCIIKIEEYVGEKITR